MILEFVPVLFLPSLITLLLVLEYHSACRLLLVCLLFHDLCSWFEVLKPSSFLDAVSFYGLFFNTGQHPPSSSSSDNASNVDLWLITAVPRLPELLLLQLQDDVRGKHQVFLYFQLVEIMVGWGTQQFFCLKCTNLIQLYKMIKVLPAGQMYGRGHAQWRPLY